jgi:hypothetical protein
VCVRACLTESQDLERNPKNVTKKRKLREEKICKQFSERKRPSFQTVAQKCFGTVCLPRILLQVQVLADGFIQF